MSPLFLATGIFLITYGIIVSERLHRTTTALLGGVLMILLGIISQEDAFHAIDLNVIFLLVGMMMIAHLLGETGVFQWIAVKAVHLGKGNPIAIMVIIAVVTAVASALLDNVTVVVLIAPVTLFVAKSLGVSPIPFLISEVMASNIGGTATLIGDPPNVLVASAAGIDFVPFAINMAPPAFMTLLAFIPIAIYQFKKDLTVPTDRMQEAMRISDKGLIRNPKLLAQAGIVLGLVMLGFLFQGMLHLEPAVIALTGATILLVWTQRDPIEVLESVEWATLMFFVGLFITVEAIVEVGLIDRLAGALITVTQGNVTVTGIFILWFSALASGVVDNIPYTATMIPLIESLADTIPIKTLWWALALGADLGGNLTLVGASANVIVATLAERSGNKLTFGMFLRYGALTVFVSLIISTIWLLVRYP